jgi:formylmethanofuran dehydrogenase subunit E
MHVNRKFMNTNSISLQHSHEPSWCRDFEGHPYTFAEYMELSRSFHGYAAPGLIIGGRMVDMALEQLPGGILFDAISETAHCMPDAIQLLTLCTTGNGWLKIVNLDRFALILYNKNTGEGVRIFINSESLDTWPEIKTWFYKLKPKPEQNTPLLREQIRAAGSSIFLTRKVQIRPPWLEHRELGTRVNCPLCGESYPQKHGSICRGCQGEAPYFVSDAAKQKKPDATSLLTSVPVQEAEGKKITHDMTRIVPGKFKGPIFKRGHTIIAGDVCRLQQMGRMNLYLEKHPLSEEEWVHEDRAAESFAKIMVGPGIFYQKPPQEGKITFTASRDGLLVIDRKRLEAFNLIPDVICSTRQSFSVVSKGHQIGGTRAIPLYLYRDYLQKALTILGDKPLLQVLPLKSARIGILITGTEIVQGLIKDKFEAIIRAKVKKLGCCVICTLIVPDNRKTIADGILALINKEVELIVTTAGLSVDPDDVTRQGLVDAGVEDILYGAPILPGAMSLLARRGQMQVIGVPACALYCKTTAFDLLLPRLLAGLEITRRDLAGMGHGTFCLECKVCKFPRCSFGR